MTENKSGRKTGPTKVPIGTGSHPDTGWQVPPAGSGRTRGGQGRWLAGDELDRFDRNVHRRPAEETPGFGPCWPWRERHTPDGYPLFDITGQGPTRAHRYAWEHQFDLFPPNEWVLEDRWSATTSGLLIPDGWTLDHLCHTFCVICRGGSLCPHTSCVRPRHLEPITRGENTRRRHARARALAAIEEAAA